MYSCQCITCREVFTADDKREPICFPCLRKELAKRDRVIEDAFLLKGAWEAGNYQKKVEFRLSLFAKLDALQEKA